MVQIQIIYMKVTASIPAMSIKKMHKFIEGKKKREEKARVTWGRWGTITPMFYKSKNMKETKLQSLKENVLLQS